MNPERWQKIQSLFEQTLELVSDKRNAFLKQACADDGELYKEVVSLLEADANTHSLLDGLALDAVDFATDFNLEGQHIGPYKIVREIGRGGMGAVYLAERAEGEFEQQVAVKLIKRGMDSDQILKRFKSERQILARLQHPNIARLLDGGLTDEGLPYFTMEYVEGESIDRYCDKNKLSIKERLKLFQKVCLAVQYAHQNLIVHRDLKPSNILVSKDGTVKLLDFGIAKMLADGPDGTPSAALTRTGLRVMTPEYAAPEQVRGEPVTTATDVYALGVILYQILTGMSPYRLQSDSPLEIEKAICTAHPDKPSTALNPKKVATKNGHNSTKILEMVSSARNIQLQRLRRELSGDLDNICLMALRKEQERRYRSAEQLWEDIRRYLVGLPVIARPDTFGYRAQKFVQRNKIAVVSAGVTVLLIVVLVTFYTIRLASERDRARLEAQKAEQISDFLTGIFEVSNPSQSKGETITARELLNRGAERIENELKNQPQVQATMMNVIGGVYVSLGLYGEAYSLYERALDIGLSTEDSDALELAKTMDDLAVLQRLKGEYKSAETFARQALELRRNRLGDQHLDVANAINNLAEALRVQGDYQSAETLYRETLSIRRSLLGDEHRDVADTMNNLALLLYTIGDYQEAERLHREALFLRRTFLGEDHPDVPNSMNNLAILLKAKGEYEEAETLYRQGLRLRRKLLGEDEPRTVNTLSNLGRLLHEKGDFSAADSLLRQALDLFRNRLGENHPYVAKSFYYLADLMQDQGNFAGAESLFRQSLELYQRLLPKGHLNIARTQIGLGRLLTDMGNPEAGVTLLQDGLEARRHKLPKDHWQNAEAQSALGGCLVALAQYERAESLLLHGYEVLKTQQGRRNQLVQKTLNRIIELYEAWGRSDKASPYRKALTAN